VFDFDFVNKIIHPNMDKMQGLFHKKYPHMDFYLWYYTFMESLDYVKKRIEQRMEELNVGQLELASKAKVSQSTINRVLNSPTNSRIDTLYKIAKALNVPLEYLVIESERKALLCKAVSDMSDQELQDIVIHIEKERLWRTQGS